MNCTALTYRRKMRVTLLLSVFLIAGMVMAQSPSAKPPNVGRHPTTPQHKEKPSSAEGLANSTTQRIQRIANDGEQALRLPLIKGFPSVVELPAGEKIMDIAVGGLSDWGEAWEIVKRDFSFYIKPLANAQMTTLLVGTTERNYVFDLHPLSNTPDNQTRRLSRLILTRPAPATPAELPPIRDPLEQKKADVILSVHTQALALEQQIHALRKEQFDKRPRNYNYTIEWVSQVDDIRPREVFDDGRFTYLKFPNALQIPAVYRGSLDATQETLVNSHIEDDYLVIHGVHTRWVLRLGGSVIGLFNEQFNAEGASSQSGTSTTDTRLLQ